MYSHFPFVLIIITQEVAEKEELHLVTKPSTKICGQGGNMRDSEIILRLFLRNYSNTHKHQVSVDGGQCGKSSECCDHSSLLSGLYNKRCTISQKKMVQKAKSVI